MSQCDSRTSNSSSSQINPAKIETSSREKMGAEKDEKKLDVGDSKQLQDPDVNARVLGNGDNGWNSSNHSDVVLITPSKRSLSAENNNQVRKRAFPLSPTHINRDNVTGVGKKKQVAKNLFDESKSLDRPVIPPDVDPIATMKSFLGGGFGGGRSASRCLFGPPSDNANRLVSDEIENKRRDEFEVFKLRYEVESVLDTHY